jgi:hypothetical protein
VKSKRDEPGVQRKQRAWRPPSERHQAYRISNDFLEPSYFCQKLPLHFRQKLGACLRTWNVRPENSIQFLTRSFSDDDNHAPPDCARQTVAGKRADLHRAYARRLRRRRQVGNARLDQRVVLQDQPLRAGSLSRIPTSKTHQWHDIQSI